MSRVFIVLAAWEPAPDLFDRQVASLSAQTYRDWSGVVMDDASSVSSQRFIAERLARESRLAFIRNPMRVGFYRNFERALALAPKDCDYVALCDQDDCWSEAKLERQVAALDGSPEARLCYTDLRLVDEDRKVIAETFWHSRPHGRSFREILYNNVVTGGTVVMRRDLLDTALPFPDDPGGAFHDHWLALCGMARGGLRYLDDSLVDYTQHGRNTIGAQQLAHVGRGALAKFVGDSMRRVILQPRQALDGLHSLAIHAVSVEAKLRSFAEALFSRCPAMPAEALNALRPFLRRHRVARALDLAGPTLLGTMAARHDTNLEPLKIPLGLAWNAVRSRK